MNLALEPEGSAPLSKKALKEGIRDVLGGGSDIGAVNPLPVTAGAGAVFDVSDRAARLLGIVYGENAQLQQLTTADAMTPNQCLETVNFLSVYDAVADDWNRVREGETVGSLLVEDTGLNTNPRRYEKDNGFYSAVIARAGGVATALWVVGGDPTRTAGQDTTIYTLMIENSTGAGVTGWLEVGGVVITPDYHVNNNETAVITFQAGHNVGNQDIDCNASVNGVEFQILGTEV